MTRADVLASHPVQRIVPAGAPLAPVTCPPVRAGAGPVGRMAGAPVLTLAPALAPRAPPAVGTLLLALLPPVAGEAPALAAHVVAHGAVVAVAAVLAPQAVGPRRARVGAHLALEKYKTMLQQYLTH